MNHREEILQRGGTPVKSSRAKNKLNSKHLSLMKSRLVAAVWKSRQRNGLIRGSSQRNTISPRKEKEAWEEPKNPEGNAEEETKTKLWGNRIHRVEKKNKRGALGPKQRRLHLGGQQRGGGKSLPEVKISPKPARANPVPLSVGKGRVCLLSGNWYSREFGGIVA